MSLRQSAVPAPARYNPPILIPQSRNRCDWQNSSLRIWSPSSLNGKRSRAVFCPGFPPDVLPAIFDPLVRYATRESAALRRPGSIGLGLYIVREIVVAKGGTMEVASTAQEGTTFTVRIPRILPIEGDNRDDAKAAR